MSGKLVNQALHNPSCQPSFNIEENVGLSHARSSGVSTTINITCTGLLLLLVASPRSDKFTKYKAVEAYEIRPGILAMPRYSKDGQVCEVGLEREHYSPELIRLDASLSREEIDKIADELAPVDERGAKTKGLTERDLILRDGGSFTTLIDYENVSIMIYGAELPSRHRSQVVQDGLAAVIHWKNRKCQ